MLTSGPGAVTLVAYAVLGVTSEQDGTRARLGEWTSTLNWVARVDKARAIENSAQTFGTYRATSP